MKNPKEHSDIRLRRTLLKAMAVAIPAAAACIPTSLAKAMPPPPDLREVLAQGLCKEYDCDFSAAKLAVYKAFRLGEPDMQAFPNPLHILAVIAVESEFNPKAVSRTGAFGLMQIQGKVHGQGFRNPAKNIEKGVEILREYQAQLGSPSRTLVGYNEGPGAAVNKCGRKRYKPCMTRYVNKVQRELDRIERLYVRARTLALSR